MTKRTQYKQLNLFEEKTEEHFIREELDVEYFDLFSWAVPEAFSDALDLCRFEEGDVLYDVPEVYSVAWGEALKHLKQGVQVTFPPRSIQKTKDKDSASVFEGNWTYPLKFDLLYFENNKLKKKKHISTTQGMFYQFLWSGDEKTILSGSNNPMPQGRRQLKEVLKEASVDLQEEVLKRHKCTEYFIMPYDKSCPLLKRKYNIIVESLKEDDVKFDTICSRPGPVREMVFLPTLQIACFFVDEKEDSVLYNSVKSLYKPMKNKKTNKDFFKIETHGVYKRINV